MHEELVKRLRELHPEAFGNAWDFAFACQQAMHKAADAIEELSKQAEKWEEIADIWRAAYAGLERRMYPKPPKEEV